MAVPSFLIKNGGVDFVSRQKNLFDVLSVAEKETNLCRPSNDEFVEIDYKRTSNNKRKRTKRFRGKESMFKVPMDPPPRLMKIEKFQRPGPVRRGRWIKYSLADVSDYDMSNEGNTAAALSFLKSLRERKREEAEKKREEEKSDNESKHIFKVSSTSQDKPEAEEKKKSVFIRSKLIMPEYVVGQAKKVKKNTQKIVKSENVKEVYLDHIHIEDDE